MYEIIIKVVIVKSPSRRLPMCWLVYDRASIVTNIMLENFGNTDANLIYLDICIYT